MADEPTDLPLRTGTIADPRLADGDLRRLDVLSGAERYAINGEFAAEPDEAVVARDPASAVTVSAVRCGKITMFGQADGHRPAGPGTRSGPPA